MVSTLNRSSLREAGNDVDDVARGVEIGDQSLIGFEGIKTGLWLFD
jgi:hypothetical protein